jgi:AcrR family transcriptional regulator
MLNMRSADITTAARIRQVALELFANAGVDGSSIRAIATKADVSPALILHHFGSKDGLCQAVDDYVVDFTTDVLNEFAEHGPSEQGAKVFTKFAEQPAVMEYMSRAVVSGTESSNNLFDRMVQLALDGFDQMRTDGLIREMKDPLAVALWIVSADLGAMFLRKHLQRHLGVDPMSPDGVARWADAEMDVVGRGLFNETGTTP